MIRKVLLVPAVAGLLLTAPTAQAAPVATRCVLGYATGAGAAAAGYAVFDDPGTHTLRCYVTVGGVERATTPTATGTGVVVTEGPVAYVAPPGSVVAICTEVDGATTGCAEVTELLRPVFDILAPVFEILERLCEVDLCVGVPYWLDRDLDPLLCPLLVSLSPGVPGVVDITPEGDTTLVGAGPFWDCPPYGNLFGE